MRLIFWTHHRGSKQSHSTNKLSYSKLNKVFKVIKIGFYSKKYAATYWTVNKKTPTIS
jgi:hypothetical protein